MKRFSIALVLLGAAFVAAVGTVAAKDDVSRAQSATVSGIAAPTEAEAVPAKLVGQWTRTVTTADAKRTGGTLSLAGSVWTLTVKKSATAAVRTSRPFPPLVGEIVPAGGANRVHMNVGQSFPNVYKWRVSGRLLTFTKIRDTHPDRAAVLRGVWKRK